MMGWEKAEGIEARGMQAETSPRRHHDQKKILESKTID